MNNPTDTNQASEYELEQYLLNDKAFQHILKFAPESQRELMTFELARYISSLIRTEKLKLLDEVRERVVGEREDEERYSDLSKYKQRKVIIEYEQIVKQLAEINKLEAEL